MNVEPRTGRFDIAFELPGSTLSRRAGLRFTGTVTETVEAAMLTRSLRLGEVVKASDVAMGRRPKAELRGDGMASRPGRSAWPRRPRCATARRCAPTT